MTVRQDFPTIILLPCFSTKCLRVGHLLICRVEYSTVDRV